MQSIITIPELPRAVKLLIVCWDKPSWGGCPGSLYPHYQLDATINGVIISHAALMALTGPLYDKRGTTERTWGKIGRYSTMRFANNSHELDWLSTLIYKFSLVDKDLKSIFSLAGGKADQNPYLLTKLTWDYNSTSTSISMYLLNMCFLFMFI